MVLLMAALVNKFVNFGEVGGSKSKVVSAKKLGDNEDSKKEPKKEP
jgi:hypothetical protein